MTCKILLALALAAGGASQPRDHAFFDTRPLTFTHIPKTGGASLHKELHVSAFEDCFDDIFDDSKLTLVMVRAPHTHVRSMFYECHESWWGRRVSDGTQMPRSANRTLDFEAWLRHFAGLARDVGGPAHDFNCYDPRDLQTRQLSCTWRRPPRLDVLKSYYDPRHPHHASAPAAPRPLARASENLRNRAGFVGLTEFYHESVCVLSYKRTRRVDLGCTCDEQRNIGATFGHQKITHGNKRSSDDEADDAHLNSLIDNITMNDQAVFEVGLVRFLRDLRIAEALSNRTFLCHDAAARLKDLSAQIHGHGRYRRFRSRPQAERARSRKAQATTWSSWSS